MIVKNDLRYQAVVLPSSLGTYGGQTKGLVLENGRDLIRSQPRGEGALLDFSGSATFTFFVLDHNLTATNKSNHGAQSTPATMAFNISPWR